MGSNCNSQYKKTEIGLVPDDWEMKSAEDFCQRVTDGTHASPEKLEEGHHLITSRHIKQGGLDFDNAYFISDRDFDEANKRSKVSQWDVIFGMIGTIGEIYLEKSDKIDYAIKNVGLFKCGNELFGKWLFFYLKSNLAKEYIRRSRSGTTQEYMTLDSLRKFPIVYPKNAEEMQKIVTFLVSIQNRIELCSLMNNNLEDIGQTIFKRWFVDFEFPNEEGKPYKSSGGEMIYSEIGEIPRDWEVATIGKLASSVTYGYTQSASSVPIGPKFLRITDIQGGKIDWALVPYCEINQDDSRFSLRSGDIVVARTGASTGENVYIEECPKSVFASYLIRIRFADKNLARYVAKFMRSPRYQDYIANSIGGSAQPNASAGTLTNMQVTVPTHTVLARFGKLVEILELAKYRNTTEIATLTMIRNLLLPRLMSGKIRVPVQKEKVKVL